MKWIVVLSYPDQGYADDFFGPYETCREAESARSDMYKRRIDWSSRLTIRGLHDWATDPANRAVLTTH